MVVLPGHQKLEESTTPLLARAREWTVKRWSQFLSSAYKCYCSPVFCFFFFFFNIVIYLFIYLAALGLSCSPWDLLWVMWDLSLWCMDCLAMVQGFSHSAACRILVPWLGIEPMSPAFGRWIVYCWSTSEVPEPSFVLFCFNSLSATSVARIQPQDPTDKESNKCSFQSSNPWNTDLRIGRGGWAV